MEGVDANRSALIEHYLELILEVNKTLNLTRIEDSQEARLLHIEDSLSGSKELEAAPDGLYGDLGSGGGFPGVPLAIASGRQTLLVDSVKKKMAAVASVIDELGLSAQIGTYNGRIEDLAIDQPGQFSALTARALSRVSVLMELASPLLNNGGHLICYKAQLSDEELDHSLSLQKYLGMKLVSDRSFFLSDNETARRIVVFEKYKDAGLKLPRRVGLAQKKPL